METYLDFQSTTEKQLTNLWPKKQLFIHIALLQQKLLWVFFKKTKILDNYFNSCELLEEMLNRDTYCAGKFIKIYPCMVPSPPFSHNSITICLFGTTSTAIFFRHVRGSCKGLTQAVVGKHVKCAKSAKGILFGLKWVDKRPVPMLSSLCNAVETQVKSTILSNRAICCS